jgi:hypothetical protein
MAKDRAARQQATPKRVAQTVLKTDQRQAYYDARISGLGKTAAAVVAGVDPKTGRKWEKAWEEAGNPPFDTPQTKLPKKKSELAPDPRRALKDFSYFQERYLGRVALPWQADAAETIVKLAASPQEEYLVINCPPGSGKSTLMIHDIGAWLIARDRGIRICVLSSTQTNAEKFANQLRKTLEATSPIRADEKQLKRGTAKDAVTTLSKDFGRFKPEEQGTWTKNKFQVDRPGDAAANKENTVEAFGKDQAFLGGRYDVVICDDIQDPSKVTTLEALNELKDWFSTYAESRIEEGGLFVLNMQRVGAEDISNYALEMLSFDPNDDDEVDLEDLAEQEAERERLGIDPLPIRDGRVRKYRHIIYKAHADGEGECKGSKFHGLKAPAYPIGCLLFPRKLTYAKMRTKEANDRGKYRLWYQQEEVDTGNVLVEPIWIKGGRDDYGVQRHGCWDNNRGVRELPEDITTDIFSFLSVDPSPSQFWAVGWWIYHRASNELYLIDLVRQRMTSAAFFDTSPNTGISQGVLVDMFEASRAIGAPLTHLIAEVNAAQKFMYDSSAIVQWLRARGVALMPHTTTTQNKNSQEFGVQGLQPWFRDGRIRLPGRQADLLLSRTRSMKLVDEVTRYKLDGTTTMTDDCVMQTWFATRAVNSLYRTKKELPRMNSRPSWIGRSRHLGLVS